MSGPTTPRRHHSLGAMPAAAPPQSFIDAGDVPWLELEPLLVRQMAALLAGEVLELQSGDPETLTTLATWCAGEGHTLIHTQPGDGFVSFWIGSPAMQGEE